MPVLTQVVFAFLLPKSPSRIPSVYNPVHREDITFSFFFISFVGQTAASVVEEEEIIDQEITCAWQMLLDVLDQRIFVLDSLEERSKIQQLRPKRVRTGSVVSLKDTQERLSCASVKISSELVLVFINQLKSHFSHLEECLHSIPLSLIARTKFSQVVRDFELLFELAKL